MSSEDIAQLTRLLAQLEPGFLPYPVFEQFARINVMSVVEFIPMRMRNEAIEVLLIDRGPNDPFWPNMLHTPGTVLRATDLNTEASALWPAFERIMQDELHDTPLGPPHFVGNHFRVSKRGTEQAQLYWVEVTGRPKIGSFYPVSALPKTLIADQASFINEAARHFAAAGQSPPAPHH